MPLWTARPDETSAGAVEPRSELLGILGGCAILFVAGLLDDLFSLGPIPKLAAQVAASLLVIGVQIFFTSFLLSILGLRRSAPAREPQPAPARQEGRRITEPRRLSRRT